jgi:uncharacterized membrane protein
MKTRQVIGLIITLIGIILLIIGICVSAGAVVFLLIYGIPLIIIGFVIFFNKHEDKIDQINYSKMKGGTNEKK